MNKILATFTVLGLGTTVWAGVPVLTDLGLEMEMRVQFKALEAHPERLKRGSLETLYVCSPMNTDPMGCVPYDDFERGLKKAKKPTKAP